MAITRQKKSQILNNLLENFKKAKIVVFGGYQGLSVKKMTNLRRELRKQEALYKIAKKTLIKLAAKKSNLPEVPESLLQSSVSLVFGFGDELSGAKILHEFGKQNKEVKIFGAFLDGRFLDENEAKALAALPGKTELIAKFMFLMQSGLYGFHGALSGLVRNFMHGLTELQKKLPQTAASQSQPQPQ